MIPPEAAEPGEGLILRGVAKGFGPVQALVGAHLHARPGEVLGVLGENGAGKTTLMGVAAGLHQPDAGEVWVDGVLRTLRSPREAAAAGIGMVQQHFALVPRLSVIENLALGTGRHRSLWAPPVSQELRSQASEVMEATGLHVPLDLPVEGLGVGLRQRVEIVKVLLRRPRVLILDEPTAVLAPQEVEGVLALLRDQAKQGTAVLLIAHKLDEVLAVAHRVTVLRRGQTVLEAPRGDVDSTLLTRAMVGREPPPLPPISPLLAGSPCVARLQGVTRHGSGGETVLDGVDLEVQAGEVVGVAGVEGNGQEALAQVLSARETPSLGSWELPSDPAYIPGDRGREALALRLALTDNVALALHREASFRRGGLLKWRALESATQAVLDRFQVQAPGPGTRAGALSGGNQQKLVVGRELVRNSPLLVAHNPTRGLDVAATRAVHSALLAAARDQGRGVVLISTDLDEILALSHRQFVLVRGSLLPVPPEKRTREGLGSLMLSAR